MPDGSHLVATSRRHRKGLLPHRVPDAESAERPRPTQASAFLHLYDPSRLAWWIAVLFGIGSVLFTLGGVGATWPQSVPMWLRDASFQNQVFASGAIFFTTAAWLQWLEALNGDVADSLADRPPPRWHWFGWHFRNLGYLASTLQLVGTVLFNLDTLDAMYTDLSRQEEVLLVWLPDMGGCVCFLLASYLTFAEVSQGAASFAPRCVSWWVAVANLLGSVAFQLSVLYGFAGPDSATADSQFRAGLCTSAGGLCFLVGSYLMIPELFDGEAQTTAPPADPASSSW